MFVLLGDYPHTQLISEEVMKRGGPGLVSDIARLDISGTNSPGLNCSSSNLITKYIFSCDGLSQESMRSILDNCMNAMI